MSLFTETVDTIVKDFLKVVSKLEALAEKHRADASDHTQLAQEHVVAASIARAEADKAENISNNIKSLLQG